LGRLVLRGVFLDKAVLSGEIFNLPRAMLKGKVVLHNLYVLYKKGKILLPKAAVKLLSEAKGWIKKRRQK
jgi:hypothetical protein